MSTFNPVYLIQIKEQVLKPVNLSAVLDKYKREEVEEQLLCTEEGLEYMHLVPRLERLPGDKGLRSGPSQQTKKNI